MKQNLNNLFLFFNLMFFSCEFNDQEIEYQEKLVVFGSIVANLPITDTVTVSKSASISDYSSVRRPIDVSISVGLH